MGNLIPFKAYAQHGAAATVPCSNPSPGLVGGLAKDAICEGTSCDHVAGSLFESHFASGFFFTNYRVFL